MFRSDTVFKYLIEDLSIAREFLSIILDVEVIELEVKPQEVSVPGKKRTQRKTNAKIEKKGNPRSLIRYDFNAKIVQANGEERTILLELQKRNHKSIIFRFRNYVARNYSIETGAPSFEQKYIYLTGFPIDSTQELPPYLWCRRQLVDGLTGNLFFPSKGINFVEELTHESCFIHVNGFREDDPHPVAQVMNLFNQKRTTESLYILEIAPPQTGTLMARIVDRLYKATHDDELMKAMELESYYEYDMQSLEDDKEALRKEAEDERRQKEDERRQKEAANLIAEDERRQKESILIASVKRFHTLGLSVEEIAETLSLTTEEVQRILNRVRYLTIRNIMATYTFDGYKWLCREQPASIPLNSLFYGLER